MSAKSPHKSSPNWKRPGDIMKLRRKKPGGKSNQKAQLSSQTGKSSNPIISRNQPVKRRNPFGQNDVAKRQKHKTGSGPDDAESQLFSVLNKLDTDMNEGSEITRKPCINTEDLSNILHQSSVNSRSEPKSEPEIEPSDRQQGSEILPSDWGLKTKIRFLSSKPFTWCHPLRSTEEAAGTSSYVRCSPSEDISQIDHAKVEFNKSCHYWMHPNIPWLKLFPRITSDARIGKMTAVNTNDEIRKSLMTDWSESFTSLFSLLRAGYCPYFYVCCHQFTALFRSAKIAGHTETHALLTPTTRGFREGLHNEGIEFSMPLKKKLDTPDTSMNEDSNSSPSLPVTESIQQTDENSSDSVSHLANEDGLDRKEGDDDNSDDDDDLAATDEGASSWLQSIGLDKSKFPSLNPDKVKIQREGYKVIDNRPESLVYVEESETQALFNYLLNCRSCVATTGPQSGIPPTLLAPLAFKGATLKSLKIMQTSVKQQNPDGTLDHGFLMEAVGPILPHMLFSLSRILNNTQSGDYQAVFSVHEPTTAFNIGTSLTFNPPEGDGVDDGDESKYGLDQDVVSHLQTRCSFVKTGVREILCKDGLFIWSS